MTASLAGKVALVTGAGGGVGRGIALALAAADASVAVSSPRDNGDETVRLVTSRGHEACWIRCDVTNRADVDAAVAETVERYGGLDVLVHNATSRRSSEVHTVDEARPSLMDEHVAVSLRAAYFCAVAGFPHLRDRRGRYLLFTSPAGMEGSRMLPLYGTVKGALRAFTKSLAIEWAEHGITVNCLSPLAMTPAMENAIREDPALEGRLQRNIPLGRVGDPEADIGPAAVFLASDAASYITGQTLPVDGGRFTGL